MGSLNTNTITPSFLLVEIMTVGLCEHTWVALQPTDERHSESAMSGSGRKLQLVEKVNHLRGKGETWVNIFSTLIIDIPSESRFIFKHHILIPHPTFLIQMQQISFRCPCFWFIMGSSSQNSNMLLHRGGGGADNIATFLPYIGLNVKSIDSQNTL